MPAAEPVAPSFEASSLTGFESKAAQPLALAALRPVLLVPGLLALDRERAVLDFNRRVLAQARRADVPLLERLRYVCIVSPNLDEFFEVRFADCLEASKKSGSGVSAADIEAIAAAAHALID